MRLAHPPKRDGTPRFVRDIDTDVLLVKLTPDLPPSFFNVLHRYPRVVRCV